MQSVSAPARTYLPPAKPAPARPGLWPPRPGGPGVTSEQFRAVEQLLYDRRYARLSTRIPQPLIRVWDRNMEVIARVMIPDDWECEEIAHDDGTATITISGKDNAWLRELLIYDTRYQEDLHITIDPDPDKPHDFKNRWGGKVVTITDKEQKGKPAVTTIVAISNRAHLSHIMLAATPVLPPAVQPIKMFMWGGPCATACASAAFINLTRIYAVNNFWPIPRNWADPTTWLTGLNPLNWPVQIMPIRVITDQSRWTTISARWKDCKTVFTPSLKDAGVVCKAYTWLPGDPPPYEHVFGKYLGKLLQPKKPTVILSFEDESGVTGPTGTAFDGLVNLFAATLDDIITEVLIPIDGDGDGETDPFFRKMLMVAPKRPPWVYRDAGYGNVNISTMTIHKCQALSIITGGKSPQWVNQSITWAIRYGLSQLAQVINYGIGAYEQYGVEGLDNLYQGQLDDTLLAFWQYVDFKRTLLVGRYGFNEFFESGQAAAFTVSSAQTLRQGWWKTRPYVTFKFDVLDGAPFSIGEHEIHLGGRVAAERHGVVYTDMITAIKRQGSRTQSGRPQLAFGDDSREQDPVARGFAAIANVANFAALLAGSGDVF